MKPFPNNPPADGDYLDVMGEELVVERVLDRDSANPEQLRDLETMGAAWVARASDSLGRWYVVVVHTDGTYALHGSMSRTPRRHYHNNPNPNRVARRLKF